MNDLPAKKNQKKAKIIYVLEGDPTFMISTRFTGSRKDEPGRRSKVIDGITINSQKPEDLEYKGPLKLTINFYFTIPPKELNKILLNKPSYHIHYPDLIDCTKYVEEVCKGIIFNNNFYIASVDSHKYYDSRPRTEFYVTELR